MKSIFNNITITLLVASTLLSAGSCKKQDDWLNAKRYKGDVTPSTLDDYQAILDYNTAINNRFINLGLIGTDNLSVADQNFSRLTAVERESYLWTTAVWNLSGSSNEWNYQYSLIEYANLILDGISKLQRSAGYDNVKGQALFFRAFAYYNLCQTFCKPYVSITSNTDLGLPLRTNPDVSKVYPRSSLKATYEMMLIDAQEAARLLDQNQSFTRRASASAANGLLAKIYLVMEDYVNAGKYSNLSLKSHSDLIDFNSNLIDLSTTYRFPIDTKNPEILFFAQSTAYNTLTASSSSTSFVQKELYDIYDENDLRKAVLFAKSGAGYKFRGSYTGDRGTFCGIASNELFLIRAESYARTGSVSEALQDINRLLRSRYKTGQYSNFSTSDPEIALRFILQERRKELPFTSQIRWEDLRRLNNDPRFKTTIVRNIGGQTYTLIPGSSAYVFPIPPSETQLSGIEQNPR